MKNKKIFEKKICGKLIIIENGKSTEKELNEKDREVIYENPRDFDEAIKLVVDEDKRVEYVMEFRNKNRLKLNSDERYEVIKSNVFRVLDTGSKKMIFRSIDEDYLKDIKRAIDEYK